MEKNEVVILEDRGFIQVKGLEAKDFLQNIVTTVSYTHLTLPTKA